MDSSFLASGERWPISALLAATQREQCEQCKQVADVTPTIK
eukprot:gene11369-9884_t